MKVMCTKRDLHEGLAAASRVTGKSTLPILMNLLIKTEPGGLEITGYDLEIGIRRHIPAQVQEEGAFTVSSKLLTDIVSALPDSHVQFNADAPGNVVLTCDRSNFDLVGLPAEEFPVLPEVGEETQVTLKVGALKAMINQVVFAASPDEARAIMTGINLTIKDGAVTMAATDGHRLAVRNLKVEGLEVEAGAIIPSRALNELARILPADDTADLVIRLGKNQAQFQMDNTILVSRLIEGQFPNFERVIPSSTDKSITMQTAELAASARRAYIVAKEASNRIILKTDGERVIVSADAGGVGRAREEVEVMREGDDIEIAFNAKYLLDVLAVLPGEGVRFELTGSLNPGLIRPVDGTDYIYVIMPMQIV